MSTLVLAEIPVQKAAEICVQSPDTVGYMDVVVWLYSISTAAKQGLL